MLWEGVVLSSFHSSDIVKYVRICSSSCLQEQLYGPDTVFAVLYTLSFDNCWEDFDRNSDTQKSPLQSLQDVAVFCKNNCGPLTLAAARP